MKKLIILACTLICVVLAACSSEGRVQAGVGVGITQKVKQPAGCE